MWKGWAARLWKKGRIKCEMDERKRKESKWWDVEAKEREGVECYYRRECPVRLMSAMGRKEERRRRKGMPGKGCNVY